MSALGQPLEATTMSAVGTREVRGVPAETVVEEVRGGFLYQGRMFRSAEVFVKVVSERTAANSLKDVAGAEVLPDREERPEGSVGGGGPARGGAEYGERAHEAPGAETRLDGAEEVAGTEQGLPRGAAAEGGAPGVSDNGGSVPEPVGGGPPDGEVSAGAAPADGYAKSAIPQRGSEAESGSSEEESAPAAP